jgi:hypothetical protein
MIDGEGTPNDAIDIAPEEAKETHNDKTIANI